MIPRKPNRMTLCDQDLHRLAHVLANNEHLLQQVIEKQLLTIPQVNLIEEPAIDIYTPMRQSGSKVQIGKQPQSRAVSLKKYAPFGRIPLTHKPTQRIPPKRYGSIGQIRLTNKPSVRQLLSKRHGVLDLLSQNHKSPLRVLPKRFGNLTRTQPLNKRSAKAPQAPHQGCSYSRSQSQGSSSRAAQINSLIHQTRRNPKDKAAPKEAIQLLLEYSKESLAACLLKCMTSIPSSKRDELIAFLEKNSEYIQTNLCVEVFKRPKDQKTKDQYQYYVRFNDVKTKQQTEGIKFQNHASAAIYTLHLVDRVLRKNNCTSIDVTQHMEALQEIYSKMFNTDKPISGIQPNLRLTDSGKYKKEKKRLNSYYNDINKVVQKNVVGLDLAWPYCCSPDSFILLKPESIIIPDELIPNVWRNRE